jgi:hypothetical protein
VVFNAVHQFLATRLRLSDTGRILYLTIQGVQFRILVELCFLKSQTKTCWTRFPFQVTVFTEMYLTVYSSCRVTELPYGCLCVCVCACACALKIYFAAYLGNAVFKIEFFLVRRKIIAINSRTPLGRQWTFISLGSDCTFRGRKQTFADANVALYFGACP